MFIGLGFEIWKDSATSCEFLLFVGLSYLFCLVACMMLSTIFRLHYDEDSLSFPDHPYVSRSLWGFFCRLCGLNFLCFPILFSCRGLWQSSFGFVSFHLDFPVRLGYLFLERLVVWQWWYIEATRWTDHIDDIIRQCWVEVNLYCVFFFNMGIWSDCILTDFYCRFGVVGSLDWLILRYFFFSFEHKEDWIISWWWHLRTPSEFLWY